MKSKGARFAALLLLLTTLTLVIGRSVIAQASTTPFKAGHTYHLEFLGSDGDINVVSAPDSSGWAAVTVLKGLGNPTGPVWVNTRLAITAQELSAP